MLVLKVSTWQIRNHINATKWPPITESMPELIQTSETRPCLGPERQAT